MPGLKNTLARLTIESLSSDSSGVGRLDGKAVFVPATAPGDDATVKIVKDMGRYAFGIVEELHVPGPGHPARLPGVPSLRRVLFPSSGL